MSTGPTKAPEQGALLEVGAIEKPERAEQPTEASGRYVSPRPFRPWQPDQGQLLPQYTRQVLGEKHLACFFADLAGVLDFSPILKAYTKECGQPAYHPVMMTLRLMYAYSRGVSSSREIERRCETDLGFRYLSGGERPDHDTLCAFRVRHLEAFRGLFVDTLRVAQEAGLKKVGHLSVDGTKVKANASKHKAMSYGRMQEAVQKLDEQVKRLLEEVAALDEQEQARYGKGSRGDELPEELNNPATRAEKLKQARNRLEADKKVALAVEKEQHIEKIRRAQQELEQEARQKAQAQGEKAEEAVVDPKAQRNFTDPQSRIMPRDGSFQQFPQAEEARAGSEAAASKERMKERTPRVDWAELLKRTFDFDVFACVRCGGRRRVLAYVKAGGGVRAILEHLGLPTAGVSLAPAQESTQAAGC